MLGAFSMLIGSLLLLGSKWCDCIWCILIDNDDFLFLLSFIGSKWFDYDLWIQQSANECPFVLSFIGS